MDTKMEALEQDVSWLRNEVATRKRKAVDTCAALDRFATDYRGVPDFCRRTDEWMPAYGNGTTFFLARQVASVSLEHLCAEFLAQGMGTDMDVRAEVVEFTGDCWAANSHKNSLVNLPVMTSLKDGKARVRTVRVLPQAQRRRLAMNPLLSSLQAQLKREQWGLDFTGPLPEFHKLLRQKAGSSNGCGYDVSTLWSDCLSDSMLPPESAFVEVEGCAQRRSMPCLDKGGYVRPPASWYYLLYLSLFLTGDRVLLATTLEEDNVSIQTLFEESIALIERQTGVKPLIVWLPHHSEEIVRDSGKPLDFTEINPAVFADDWRTLVSVPSDAPNMYATALSVMHQLARLPIPE